MYLLYKYTYCVCSGVYILIAAGALMMVVGFLGCCGAIQESPCMLGLVRTTFLILHGTLPSGFINFYSLTETSKIQTLENQQFLFTCQGLLVEISLSSTWTCYLNLASVDCRVTLGALRNTKCLPSSLFTEQCQGQRRVSVLVLALPPSLPLYCPVWS